MVRRRQLPPMNALKAFDAAARCGGFTAAALELLVSPGAVSRHVANLEEFFGEPLFDRHHNEIQLTAAGNKYFSQIRPALDVIEDASRRIVEPSNPRQVRVTSGPGLGRDWLLPRLSEFTTAHSDIEIELTTSLALVEEIKLEGELDLGEMDIIIHYSLTDLSSENCTFLFETELQAVCSPNLPGLHIERDLHHQTLLYGLHTLTAWRQWFDLARIEQPSRVRAMKFGDGSLAVQAAINGLGVALGESVCVAKELETGRLVSPFLHRLRTGNKFFMTVNPARANRPGVKRFSEWILEQARLSAPSASMEASD